MKRLDVRKCIKCNVILNENNQYHTDIIHRHNYCKTCRKIDNAKYVDLEKQNERSKKYYYNHKEHYKEYKKIYYLKNHKKCISDVVEWQRRQREHYKYILDLPDNEFLEIVRNFYRGEK